MHAPARTVRYFLTALIVSFSVLIGGWLSPTPTHAQPTEGASISGIVTTADPDVPLNSVQVKAYRWDDEDDYYNWEASGDIDSNGEYSIIGLPAGKYIVEFRPWQSPLLIDQWWTGTDTASSDQSGATPFTLALGDNKTDVNIRLQAGATISGTVTTADTGVPLNSVEVTAYRWDDEYDFYNWEASGDIDSDGKYSIIGLPAGKYIVKFDPWGSPLLIDQWWTGTDTVSSDHSGATPFTLALGDNKTDLNIRLQAGATISGTVTAADTGGKLEDVEVVALRWDDPNQEYEWQESGYTNEDGEYTITGLPAGKYIVKFESGSANSTYPDQWWTNTDTGSPDESEATPFTLALGDNKTDLNIRLQAGATISGTVTAADTGGKLEDVRVRAFRWNDYWEEYEPEASDFTNEDGEYTITELPAGKYIVKFESGYANPTYAYQWWTNTDTGSPDESEATPFTLALGDNKTDVNIRLQAGATISGTVTAADTGSKLEDVRVRAFRWNDHLYEEYEPGERDYTNKDGEYTITGLPAGRYIVKFESGYANPTYPDQWWTNTDTGPSDESEATPFTLAPGGNKTDLNANLQVGATITGTVTAADTGEPIKSATIRADRVDGGEAYYGHTESNGEYSIVGLPAGQYIIEFSYYYTDSNHANQWWTGTEVGSPLRSQAKPLNLSIGQNQTDIDAALLVGSTISGTVTATKSGREVDDVRVRAYLWDDQLQEFAQNYSAFTNGDGKYYITGLPAGNYLVEFKAYDKALVTQWWTGTDTGSLYKHGGTPLALLSGEIRTGVNANLDPSSVMIGRVTAADTGKAARVSSVVAYRWDDEQNDYVQEFYADTYSDGEYEIDGLPAGKYLVRFVSGTAKYLDQWWDGMESKSDATPIIMTSGRQKKGIDARLNPKPAFTVGTPTITGTTKVGETLTANPGEWTDGTAFTYQWLRNSTDIDGATSNTYRLDTADAGHQIAVKVTGTKTGYNPASATSEPTETITTPNADLTVGTPTITGTVKAGKTLTAKPGKWTSGTTFTYQWLRGGKVIKGATKSTYKVLDTDGGKKLAVIVTGSKTGFGSASATSALTKTVPLSSLKTATPKISGTAKAGKTLTANPGKWSSGTTFKYQWYRGSSKISGATSAKYKLVKADVKKKIKVKVTGSKEGYASASKTSKSTKTVKK